MADYNALFQAPNAGASFAQGFQQGQQTSRENTARSALAALAQDPTNQRAYQALAQVSPDMAMQWRSQQQEQMKAQLAQHQENILKGAEIIRAINPKDQAGWDRARQAAMQAGIDLSEVPAQFDPTYAQNLVGIADALKPVANNDVVNIPYQAGGGVLQYDKRTGETRQLVVPNDGSQPAGAPVSSAPQPGHIEDGYRFKGGNPADPNAWEKVGGATGSAPSRGFP